MYVPGIDAFGNSVYGAESRGRNSFPTALVETLEEAGYQPQWFSYRSTGRYEGDSAQYFASETTQSLDISARALDEQLRGLITMARGGHPEMSDPQIVIVAHSLGGAVAARWAAAADGDILDTVKTVFTFDSPVAGIDAFRGFFGGEAGIDLQDPREIARFEHGARRVDFAQVGNVLDSVVPVAYSFTLDPWRKLNESCLESVLGTGHDCSKQLAVDNGFVTATLAGISPIWSGTTSRPGPLPEMPGVTDLSWVDISGAEVMSVTRGTVVILEAKGTGLAGLSVIVRIREVDLFSDDDIAVGWMEFSSFSGSASWTTIWMLDGLDGPEYVFSVLGFDSPELKVN